MTLDELDALPVVPSTLKVVWREDADPFGYFDKEDVEWICFRQDGVLVRARRSFMASGLRPIPVM